MPPFRLNIDPDIRTARTPPGALYSDADVYRACLERIFARSWQFVADDSVARVPGDVYPFMLLDGALAEPLLLTRDQDDSLHCFSNVCTHRGALVCEHPGVERHLRCRYHGRRFSLDGKFQGMPEFEQTANFPGPADDLAPAALARFENLLFASLEPFVDFDSLIEPVRQRVGWMPLSQSALDPTRGRDYLVRCNWALYCENYLEGFHIPFVHASLSDVLDYAAYRTELFDWCSLQIGYAKPGEPCFDAPRESPDHGQRVAAYYWWVFPNLMLNFYPWGLSINVVRPLDVDRTKVSFITYVWDPAKLDTGAGAGLDRVEREDEDVVESVQRGVRARLYRYGRYSPTREQGTHHFHLLLARFLNPS